MRRVLHFQPTVYHTRPQNKSPPAAADGQIFCRFPSFPAGWSAPPRCGRLPPAGWRRPPRSGRRWSGWWSFSRCHSCRRRSSAGSGRSPGRSRPGCGSARLRPGPAETTASRASRAVIRLWRSGQGRRGAGVGSASASSPCAPAGGAVSAGSAGLSAGLFLLKIFMDSCPFPGRARCLFMPSQYTPEMCGSGGRPV